MVQVSPEAFEEFKEIYRKQYKEEISDTEAHTMIDKLCHLYGLFVELQAAEYQRQDRLKREPLGFPAYGDWSCYVCGESIDAKTGWYDKGGHKCFPCRDAVRSGIVPLFVCRNDHSFFRAHQLDLQIQTIRKQVRQGTLIPRTIPGSGTMIFLKKENLHLIDQYRPDSWQKSYRRHEKKRQDARERAYFRELRAKHERVGTSRKV
jgi:hypothetical protein